MAHTCRCHKHDLRLCVCRDIFILQFRRVLNGTEEEEDTRFCYHMRVPVSVPTRVVVVRGEPFHDDRYTMTIAKKLMKYLVSNLISVLFYWWLLC